MSLGDRLQWLAAGMILRFGQECSVRVKGTTATSTVWAMPQDVDPGVWNLELEAGLSVASKDMTQFVVSGFDVLAEGVTELYYDGYWRRVLAAHGSPLQGVQPIHVLLTTRQPGSEV